MQYTEKELAQLIETVESEFTAHLSKAEVAHKASLAKSEGASAASLNKAEDKKEEKAPSEKKPESKEAPKADAAPAADAPADAAPAEEAAPAADAAPAAPADAAAPAAAPADASGYDAEDMAHMDKMYASMSPAELKAHHDSIRRALDAQTAQAPAPAAAAAAPAAPAAAPEMGKSEIKDENPVLNSKPTDKGNETNTAYNKNSGGKIASTGEPKASPGAKSPASKNEGVQMDKSEKTEIDLVKSELEAEKAKSNELKKNFEVAQEFLTKLVSKIGAPKAKAITEIAALTKNEDAGGKESSELSKAEITEVLMKKSSDPKLSKADREAINSFYLNKTDISTINHLLKN